jgi:NAD(P)H dehydrogenase (quinone)
VPVSDAELIEGIVAVGLPQSAAELIASFGTAIREGQLQSLSTAVEDLTGRAPATLRSVLEPALIGAA